MKKVNTRFLFTVVAVLTFLTVTLMVLTGCGAKPSGSYTAKGILGIQHTVTFEGDIMEMDTLLVGTQKYKYEIRNDGTEILVTDVVTNQSKIYSYKYIKDPACVVIDGTAYYK